MNAACAPTTFYKCLMECILQNIFVVLSQTMALEMLIPFNKNAGFRDHFKFKILIETLKINKNMY